MLQISLLAGENSDVTSPWEEMVANGELLQDSAAVRQEDGDLHAYVYNLDSSLRLVRHTIDDLRNQFSFLELKLHSPFPELLLTATFLFDRRSSEGGDILRLRYQISVQDWAGPWSIGAYGSAIREAMDASEHSRLKLYLLLAPDSEDGAWRFDCNLTDHSISAGEEINHWIQVTSDVIGRAKTALVSAVNRDTLVTLFDFPPHVSTACEQYLLYFVQFLRDLGIEADASIKHEAHQVLFSVTPNEGAEALDRIREALEIYLRLPDSREFAAQAPAYGDIAVQQLQANIYHLKGQLMVAGAVLQAKNAQIEALQLSNFTYQQLLANQQQIATIPLLPPGSPNADVEPLVPGVIDVTKYEGKGFTVNFAEVLRRLKRRFDQE